MGWGFADLSRPGARQRLRACKFKPALRIVPFSSQLWILSYWWRRRLRSWFMPSLIHAFPDGGVAKDMVWLYRLIKFLPSSGRQCCWTPIKESCKLFWFFVWIFCLLYWLGPTSGGLLLAPGCMWAVGLGRAVDWLNFRIAKLDFFDFRIFVIFRILDFLNFRMFERTFEYSIDLSSSHGLFLKINVWH